MTRAGPLSIEFAVTPRFDVFYALYWLTSSAPSALDPWKEKALRQLPRDFEPVARRVAPLPIFWPLLADAIQGIPGEVTFDELLSALREMSADELQRSILSGIFHDRASVDSLVAQKQTLKQVIANDKLPGGELLAPFGLRSYTEKSESARAISRVLSEPSSFRDELILVLGHFWRAVFRRDWSALEPRLRAESFRMRDLREERSVPEVALELNLPVAFDDKAREIRPKTGPSIDYDLIDRCYVIPSAFNARRWWAKYTTDAQKLVLYFPVTKESETPNAIVEDEWTPSEVAGNRHHSISAESVFRALGDTTRYAIASILARAPTTSAELARSLKVSKPTITHHVQALRSAGLLRETPSGGSTKLSLSKETVAAISGAALEQLFSSTAALPLATTRKRHRA
jgi:ArsR family transcriptional regulator, repressor of sdpIR and other operons